MLEGETRRAVDAEIVEDAVGGLGRGTPGFWLAVVVLAVLTVVGVIGVAVRLAGGSEHREAWGYYAATFAFLLSTVQAAPIMTAILRFTKADWRRPITRAVELLALGGVVSFLLFLPLPGVLPPLQGRANIWFDYPLGAPGFWDTLAVLVLVLTGLAILYFALIPDLAVVRDRQGEGYRGLYARFSLGWQGTKRQWLVLQSGLVLLGAFYIMHYVMVNVLISTDFSMSLIPGWRSAIFPAYHAVTGLEGGLALVVLTLALMRSVGGLSRYLGLDQFWGLAKIMLALGLFWFYFWWSDFLTLWYGRTPREQAVLQLLMTDSYRLPFILAAVLCFLVPFLVLIWNRLRVSILGPTLVAVAVLVGIYFDRVRLYVSAFSVEEMSFHGMEAVPPTHFPDLADAAIVVGALSAVALLYLLALLVVPAINLWEVKEGLLLRVSRPFLRSRVTIIGKPR